MKRIIIFIFMALMSFSIVSAVDFTIYSNNQANTYEGAPTTPNPNNILIRSDSTQNGRGYFDYNLSSYDFVPALVTNAYVTLNKEALVSPISAIYINWYACADTFNENTITWNNQNTEVTGCTYLGFQERMDLIGTNTVINLTNYIQTTGNKEFTIKGQASPESYSTTTRYVEYYYYATPLYVEYVQPITIESNLSQGYNYNNISTFLNTSENVNMSYVLDSGNETFICSNCNNSILNLTSLSEGSHNITFIANTLVGEFNSTYIFVIDTINPVINNNILTEYDSYTFDFNSSCSDTNLDYCNISLNSQNVALNTSSFTSTLNGIISYSISAMDLAGNSLIENGTIFINPYQYFYFNDTNNNPINNYNFNDILYFDVAAIKLYDLGLGNHTLIFDKSTYQLTNISFTLTNTSAINLTSVIGFSQININVYDRDTLALITQNVNFELLNNGGSSFGAIFNTSNGTIQYVNSSFINGDYILTASSTDYNTVEYYFSYSGKENSQINLYLLESNKTDDAGDPIIVDVKIIIQDAAGFNVGDGYILKILQQYASEDGATFIVDSGKTNAQGEVLLNLEFNSIFYSILIEYGGETLKRIDTFKITKYGTNCNLGECYYFSIGETTASGDNYASYDNIDFNLRYVNLTNSSGYIQFTFNDNDNLVGGFCLDTYQKVYFDWTLIDTSCLSAASGVISTIINGTDDSSFKAIGYIQDDSTTLGTIYVEDQDLALEWDIYGLVGTIVLFFVVIGIGSYAASKNIQDAPAITLALMVGVMWATDTLQMVKWGYTILFSVTLIVGVIVWLLYRQK